MAIADIDLRVEVRGSREWSPDELGEVGPLEPVVRTPLRAAVHQVPGVGIARCVRLVVIALVQESAREDGQTASLHFQRHEIRLFVVDLMVKLVRGHPVAHFGAVVQFACVAARQAPEAAVCLCCVLQRHPET